MSLEVNNSCLDVHHVSRKSIWDIFSHELMHHLPYGTLSVACALMVLSMVSVFFVPDAHALAHHAVQHSHDHGSCGMVSGMDILFHSFHFTHILFAASGAMVTFYRYSKNVVAGILLGIFSSVVFIYCPYFLIFARILATTESDSSNSFAVVTTVLSVTWPGALSSAFGASSESV